MLTAVKGNDAEKFEDILSCVDSAATKLNILNATDDRGRSALYWASVNDNWNLFNKLLASDAIVDQLVIQGKSQISELFIRMCFVSNYFNIYCTDLNLMD